MSVCEGIYDVRYGGEKCGTVSVQRSGLYSVFRCRCLPSGASVYRLCAVCGRKTVPVGIPVPEGGFLCLKKSMSQNELCRLGIESPEYFILQSAGSGWQPYKIRGWLTKKEAETTLIAVPLRHSEPFPLMEIFCFGTPEIINGSTFLVFEEVYLRFGTTSIQ